MTRKWQVLVVLAVATFAATGLWLRAGGTLTHQQRREALTKQFNAGNFKDAYDGLRKLTLDPKNDPELVGNDLELAIQALQRLGRVDEIDEFREAVVSAHAENWRLLNRAAMTYLNVEHHGHIVAGKFNRGHRRAGGMVRYVNSYARDRVRALQLFEQAINLTAKESDKRAVASFHFQLAGALLHGGGYHGAWRLQYLTDLSKLPDYDDGHYFHQNHAGAPVDAEGNPVYHHLPKTYAEAKSDGERWRWNLMQAAELDPSLLNEVELTFAGFLKEQFDVHTMAQFRYRHFEDFGEVGEAGEQDEPKTGVFAVHTLGEDETIAKLATGIKRFKLPEEFNWLTIYRRVADRGKSGYGERALESLAGTFENRRQYVKAADTWRRAIAEYGPGSNSQRRRRLEQIINNWGRFEPSKAQAAGTSAHVDFRFRNATKVSFEAHEIKVGKLLDDVKVYLTGHTGQLDHFQMNIQDIGYRLVERQENQYLGAKAASWDLDLKPRPGHYDDLVTVKTPLSKPGAYLVTAKVADGNVGRIIVWLNDTIILKKQLDGKAYYFVADANTGAPVAKANVEFFGWRQIQTMPNRNAWQVLTSRFVQDTDADGQIVCGEDKQPAHHQWLVTARKAKEGKDETDRFAYLGFTNVWYERRHDQEYEQTRVLAITDRPVYRPEQNVQFKLWVRHSKYDQPDVSTFAGHTFTVVINDPKGEKILEKSLVADAWGGIRGELYLPKGATLGQYSLHIANLGGGSFRVEEYKKPEFDVAVDAPSEPVMLGETIDATITAKYYFGAPVSKATVKYKVLRTPHRAQWYPRGDWDWYYGPGYWWYAPDYPWYPGFVEWGCRRPHPWWIHRGGHAAPEVVLEQEVPIGADGTVKVSIDTKAAKELHGNQDHSFSITAEVVDESRRTIVGTGKVLVARKPFQVHSWVDRGHYQAGDTVKAHFRAQTLAQKPVQGKGELTLFKITYKDAQPVETPVEKWALDTNAEGIAHEQIKAAKAGQYRLSYKLTDAKNHTIEGGYLFTVRGTGFTGAGYRFNDVELIADKREYQPGDQVKLMINNNQEDGTVLLFARPTNNVYLVPKVIRLKGKSVEEQLEVVQRDMPNMFVEVVTIHGGRVHSETRELVVPPEKRILNVAIEPSQREYKPGEKATVQIKLTDLNGNPFVGSTVVSVYDKSVEYISGGSNVPEIKAHFWKWRRHHYPRTESSLQIYLHNLQRSKEIGMGDLGVFGSVDLDIPIRNSSFGGRGGEAKSAARNAAPASAPVSDFMNLSETASAGRTYEREESLRHTDRDAVDKADGAPEPPILIEPTVRKNFADTAYWNASVITDAKGQAEVSFTMPEQLTGWRIKVWGMGHGTKVGQGEAEVVTKKDLIVRLQAPRFFVEKDEVVLSANVHNYLKKQKSVKVVLETEGGTLKTLDNAEQTVMIAAGGEKRVDWRVKVVNEGEAVVRMKALTDEDSDAMQMRFPAYIHGMLKMESFTGVIRPEKSQAQVTFKVPAERRINDTVLEVRYSPTLAGALVDALPYLVDYPYGCTEQTLNRFLPTVITQKVLTSMKLDLKEIEKHRTNLNSQEIGNDPERIKQWKRQSKRNPVFDEAEVANMTRAGIDALAGMQINDGGWGWFSGFGERSYPHTTAVVVHGLQLARDNGVALPQGMLERGKEWLKSYQLEEVRKLKNAPSKTNPWKEHADNLDAMVYMVLTDGGFPNADMQAFLYRDRTHIAVYAKAMFGLALHKQQQKEQLDMILENIGQYLVEDDANQTAYLKLPANNYWWYWYGNDIESNAYVLKLLSRTNAKDQRAAGLVKYLLNNRRHATYWNSTRDTAVCIEAMADYLKLSGEESPDMTIEVYLDGMKYKEVRVDRTNLFSFDNKLVMLGDAVTDGKHVLEIKRVGKGPVYFNAYLTNFTLEDHITRAGLEVQVNRKYYKLTRVDEKTKVSGSRGQALDQKVEKYTRTELENFAQLKSGDLVEVELEIDSKNDYEYLIFEDMKPAGFEPVQVRSGYVSNALGAYMELRDEKVCFFARTLSRGKHSVSYRMRAETPGQFSALPTRAYAMYAPELKGNSDEIKLRVSD